MNINKLHHLRVPPYWFSCTRCRRKTPTGTFIWTSADWVWKVLRFLKHWFTLKVLISYRCTWLCRRTDQYLWSIDVATVEHQRTGLRAQVFRASVKRVSAGVVRLRQLLGVRSLAAKLRPAAARAQSLVWSDRLRPRRRSHLRLSRRHSVGRRHRHSRRAQPLSFIRRRSLTNRSSQSGRGEFQGFSGNWDHRWAYSNCWNIHLLACRFCGRNSSRRLARPIMATL